MTLHLRKAAFLALIVFGTSTTLSGCAAYRTSSNIETSPPPEAAAAMKKREVIVTDASLSNRKKTVIGTIDVSVKKLTIFHKDPTREQANEALAEKAQAIGADAVVDVTYKSGVGFTTWGYIDALGTAVRFEP